MNDDPTLESSSGSEDEHEDDQGEAMKSVTEITIKIDGDKLFCDPDPGEGYREKWVEWHCEDDSLSFAVLFVVTNNMPFTGDRTGGYAAPGDDIALKVKAEAPIGYPYKYTVVAVEKHTGRTWVADPQFIIKV